MPIATGFTSAFARDDTMSVLTLLSNGIISRCHRAPLDGEKPQDGTIVRAYTVQNVDNVEDFQKPLGGRIHKQVDKPREHNEKPVVVQAQGQTVFKFPSMEKRADKHEQKKSSPQPS